MARTKASATFRGSRSLKKITSEINFKPALKTPPHSRIQAESVISKQISSLKPKKLYNGPVSFE